MGKSRVTDEILADLPPRDDAEERLVAEHIRQTCEAIQAGWSERERAKRAAWQVEPATFPEWIEYGNHK